MPIIPTEWTDPFAWYRCPHRPRGALWEVAAVDGPRHAPLPGHAVMATALDLKERGLFVVIRPYGSPGYERPEPIRSKSQMYDRLNAGWFGHTLGSTETLAGAEAMVARGGRFATRSKVSNSGTVYNLTAEEALARVRALPAGTWNLSPMLEDAKRVCYGHLYDAVGGWFLQYSDTPKPCKLMPSKDGCEQKWLERTAARVYLRSIMDDIGWQTLLDLVDAYPDHCVEFTVMADSRSAHGPSNVIFWEVRSLCGAYERDTWGKTG